MPSCWDRIKVLLKRSSGRPSWRKVRVLSTSTVTKFAIITKRLVLRTLCRIWEETQVLFYHQNAAMLIGIHLKRHWFQTFWKKMKDHNLETKSRCLKTMPSSLIDYIKRDKQRIRRGWSWSRKVRKLRLKTNLNKWL